MGQESLFHHNHPSPSALVTEINTTCPSVIRTGGICGTHGGEGRKIPSPECFAENGRWPFHEEKSPDGEALDL